MLGETSHASDTFRLDTLPAETTETEIMPADPLIDEDLVASNTPERLIFEKIEAAQEFFTAEQLASFRQEIWQLRKKRLANSDVIARRNFSDEQYAEVARMELHLQRWDFLLQSKEADRRAIVFVSKDPASLQTQLRNGARHPRFESMANSLWADTVGREPIGAEAKRLETIVPTSLREVYLGLRRQKKDEWKQRIANQLENGFFAEAAEGLEMLAERAPEEDRSSLHEKAKKCRTESEKTKERFEQLQQLGEQLLELVEQEFPERQEEMRERKKTERILREGVISQLSPFVQRVIDENGEERVLYSGASKPMRGVVELEIDGVVERREVMVKYANAERYLRRGVLPGSGVVREVILTMHSLAMGAENVPAVVLKNDDEHGAYSVHEFIDARSCALPTTRDWHRNPSPPLEDQIVLGAIEDHLLDRLDGEVRNLLLKDDRLSRIDFGVDFPAALETAERCSALLFYVQDKMLTARQLERLKRFNESERKNLFRRAVELLPEKMNGALERYEARLTQLLGEQKLPPYDATWRQNFGDSSLHRQTPSGTTIIHL